MSRLELDFPCMGSRARVLLADRVPGESPSPQLAAAARRATALLAELEARWSRFRPDSDLCALNADPREVVPAHQHVRALVRAGAWAGRASRGLVDVTLVDDVIRAGYADHWTGPAAPLDRALATAPARRPATAHPAARWRELRVDDRAGTVRRAPGIALDSGGIGKGLAADLVASELAGLRYVVDVGGDLALGHGGLGHLDVDVAHPIGGGVAHRLRLGGGGVATSGIDRRLWSDEAGHPAHHLLDPATGRPAWTGLIAATAVGRTALEAEVRAKAALLSGPRGARRELAEFGGALVHEDGTVDVVPPLRRMAARVLRKAA